MLQFAYSPVGETTANRELGCWDLRGGEQTDRDNGHKAWAIPGRISSVSDFYPETAL